MYFSTQPPAIKDKPYYVYGHYRVTTGHLFYIGAGRDLRYKQFYNRSKWWKRVMRKHGVIPIILEANLSYEESRKKEIQLIAHYRKKGEALCNMTDGGDGTSGCAKTDETKKRISVAQKGRPKKNPAYNKGKPMSEEQKEKLRKPKTEAHKKKQSEIMKANWAKIPKDKRPKVDNSGVNNPRYDPTIYSFVHKNGETFTGTRLEMKEKNGVNVKRLFFANPQKHVGGWRLADN